MINSYSTCLNLVFFSSKTPAQLGCFTRSHCSLALKLLLLLFLLFLFSDLGINILNLEVVYYEQDEEADDLVGVDAGLDHQIVIEPLPGCLQVRPDRVLGSALVLVGLELKDLLHNHRAAHKEEYPQDIPMRGQNIINKLVRVHSLHRQSNKGIQPHHWVHIARQSR